MTLEEKITKKLKDFGVSDQFVEIALYYKSIYRDEIDIEEFIEFVEEEYAKVEAEQFQKLEEKQTIAADNLFSEFEDEEEL